MSAYDTAVLADSPVGYWPLNETSGTVAHDLSVNNLPGTYTAGAVLGASPLAAELGDSLDLPNAGGMIVPANILYALTPNEFSIEAWIKPAALGGFQEVISSASGAGYRMLCTNNTLWFYVGGNGAILSGNLLANGVPHHVVMVMDNANSDCTLYLDGLPVLTGLVNTLPGGAQEINIGSLDGTGTQQYNGLVSNVAVYATALSAAQVGAHYSAGIVGGVVVPKASNPTPLGMLSGSLLAPMKSWETGNPAGVRPS